MKTSKSLFWIFLLMYMLCGCGGGGGGNGGGGGENPPEEETEDDENNTANISGVWRGRASTNYTGEEEVVFNLVQKDEDISGEFTCSNAMTGWRGQTDTIEYRHQKGISITGAALGPSNNNIVYLFIGTIKDNIYSGEVGVVYNNTVMGSGYFVLNKEVQGENSGEHDEQCENERAWCNYNCRTATCSYHCYNAYSSCLQGNSGGGGGSDQPCVLQCNSDETSCSSICSNMTTVFDEEDMTRRQQCWNECAQKKDACVKACN
jgi:hypothetical protein